MAFVKIGDAYLDLVSQEIFFDLLTTSSCVHTIPKPPQLNTPAPYQKIL